MRYSRRLLTVGLSVLSLLALSFTAITTSASAVLNDDHYNRRQTRRTAAVNCARRLERR